MGRTPLYAERELEGKNEPGRQAIRRVEFLAKQVNILFLIFSRLKRGNDLTALESQQEREGRGEGGGLTSAFAVPPSRLADGRFLADEEQGRFLRVSSGMPVGAS